MTYEDEQRFRREQMMPPTFGPIKEWPDCPKQGMAMVAIVTVEGLNTKIRALESERDALVKELADLRKYDVRQVIIGAYGHRSGAMDEFATSIDDVVSTIDAERDMAAKAMAERDRLRAALHKIGQVNAGIVLDEAYRYRQQAYIRSVIEGLEVKP